jgi:hypothetical protein
MPTSGNHFTAQAPLFPVFLLGLASTNAKEEEHKEHRMIAWVWFDQVVGTPVRSVGAKFIFPFNASMS